MTKTTRKPLALRGRKFIVLDPARAFQAKLGGEHAFWVSKTGDLKNAFSQSSADSVWIVKRQTWTNPLINAALKYSASHPRRGSFGDLLLLEPPARCEIVPSLRAFFRRVIGEISSFKMLPSEQLAEVLSSKDRADLFIGGIVDEGSKTLTLARGDLQILTVPWSAFPPVGPRSPNFQQFELDDYGYAIRFGDYEASAHSVLYAADPEYRRRVKRQRREAAKGFGPSLRRLRMLRKKSRGDFPGVSAKTVARIERGETGKPQGNTLDRIAQALDVRPEEIDSY